MFRLNILFSFFFLSSVLNAQDSSFLEYQLAQPRVAEAYQEKYQTIKEMFEKKGVSFPCTRVYWRAFKWNKSMELWAYHNDSMKYLMIKSFPICEIVGDLGPKRQEGDFQIPEGFYYLTNFNSHSKYHLSMKINY